MKWSYKLGSIQGIPIKLHVSFLIILLLFIWIFAVSEFEIFGIFIGFGGMDIPTWLKYLFSTIASVLFFSTVLFHELSHSLVAKSYGTKILSITLFALGGVAQMEEIPKDPRMEAKMAAAGPAFSLGIGILTYAIYYLFGPVSPAGETITNAALIVVGIIAFYNIILGLFNLIPAFPMDGGRILRAFFAMRMPYLDATRRAVAVGKSFAFAMGIFGLLLFARGGMWLMLIAVYLYFVASEEEKATIVSVSLEGIKVRNVMTSVPNVVHVPPDWTVNQLVDLMFRAKHMGYPVQESLSSPVLGVVTFADVRQIPAPERDITRVKDIMNRELISIGSDADALDALKLMASRNVGRLIVMDAEQIAGITSRTDLMRAIQFRGA
ncbi:Zinc metalloprotease [ANME-1 cluster archaeon GoMg3.2]|nr:Zinc metalloprotease [ANME-1 cluster archaeon GoMg3.2]